MEWFMNFVIRESDLKLRKATDWEWNDGMVEYGLLHLMSIRNPIVVTSGVLHCIDL
jgi:hypothetical protein